MMAEPAELKSYVMDYLQTSKHNWTVILPGTAFHHQAFKWVRFVTLYQDDPIFEYWEMDRIGKTQKFSMLADCDYMKPYPEKNYYI